LKYAEQVRTWCYGRLHYLTRAKMSPLYQKVAVLSISREVASVCYLIVNLGSDDGTAPITDTHPPATLHNHLPFSASVAKAKGINTTLYLYW
jgi:hypothetical protein